MTRARPKHRDAWIIGIIVYALLLTLSPAMRKPIRPVDQRPASSRDGVEVPAFTADGRVTTGERTTAVISVHDHRPDTERGLPVVFLHGSPGSGDNADRLAPGLLADGRRVIAPDLPGFGRSDRDLPDIGARAHARYVLALMDALGVERAHAVGWSNGGAVALNMADLAPDRVASMTLIASVGVPETESSGSYAFEHAKYRVGRPAMRALQILTPNFGLFGSPSDLEWIRNFAQTDQHRLRPIMAHTETPTLILHGRHDFLTPAWGAEWHHELTPASRLVMLDASHFIPVLQAEEAAGFLEPHFARHDTPGVPPLTGYENLCPNPERHGVARAIDWLGRHVRWAPWWVLIPAIALLARWRPELATVLVGMYVGRVDLDMTVAWLGLVAGRLARRRTPFDGRRLPIGWIATAAWAYLSLLAVFLLEQNTFWWHFGPDDAALRFGTIGFALWAIVGSTALHVARNLPRRRGRQRVLAQLTRLRRHEYWPTWVMYAPVAPIWLGRLFKPGGPLAFTAVNPGIPCGGGLAGEPKAQILRAFGGAPEVLAHAYLDAGPTPDERADRAMALLRERPELGGLPCVIKPDTGERGSDVRLARTEGDVRAYLRSVRVPVIVQRYHPGPAEFGVFWIRDPATIAGAPAPGARAGSVYAVTRKVFAHLEGDGRRTLGELILAHPRHRCQAGLFFRRFGPRTREVIPAGERVRLAHSGNHAQGTEFRDGSGLITPELERAIDAIAARYADDEGRGIDFGRFDVRCASDDAFSRGEGLAVIELNGVVSEATNHYDPDRSCFWAWGVLRGQWKRLYELADARLAAGARPLGPVECWRLVRRLHRPRTFTD